MTACWWPGSATCSSATTAFGVEVARRLAGRPLPAGVAVVDYGIRGMHLAYDLLDGYDALVIVDAAPRGGRPGDVVVLEVGEGDFGDGRASTRTAWSRPRCCPASARWAGGCRATYVVGCEPADVDEGIGLSAPVARPRSTRPWTLCCGCWPRAENREEP